MFLKKPYAKITNRDLDILNILWNSEKPMTAAEITATDDTLTTNTVQAVLRKLLKQEWVEVADIVYSGTVLCRSYQPTMTSKEFALTQLAEEFKELQSEVSTSSLVAALLDNEPDIKKREAEIEALEQLLADYKKSIR